MSSQFNIRTIEVLPVEGETPKWYDPFGCPENAIVNLPDGRKCFIDIKSLAVLRARCSDTDQFIEVLSKYSGDEPMNPKQASKNVGFTQVSSPFPSFVSRAQDSKFPFPRNSQDSSVVTAPSVQVDIFIPSSKFSFSTYFHEVLSVPPYVILVFNSAAVGFPKMFPQPGSMFIMNCQDADIDAVPVTALGLNFSHAGYEYCVLINSSHVAPENISEEPVDSPTENLED